MESKKSSNLEKAPVTREKEKSETATEQSSQEGVQRKFEESQVSYLQRAGELITKEVKERTSLIFDPSRPQENALSQSILDMIQKSMTEALKPQEDIFNPAKNEEILKNISENINCHDKHGLRDSASFDKTERNRKFFEMQSGKKRSNKRETYWNTLFFPYNTEATRAFAKKILDDKTIVLLGGGRSQLKKELQGNNIFPKEIVNVDPFVENPAEGSDPIIPLSASDENFIEKMKDNGITKADEILAEYSVPAYLEDPREIRQLFQNIDELLAEGGSARIWPIQINGKGENEDQVKRKNELINSLANINATKKYELISYKSAGRDGIILHKLAPTKKELQEKEDQEKIANIRKKIETLS